MYAPERLFHPFRRRAAIAALSDREPPRSFLVVCHGNICRSPYAAAALRRLVGGGRSPVIGSAGFIGPPGRLPPPDAIGSASERGIDLTQHRSRVMTPRDVRGADLVLVMDGEQQRAICRSFGKDPRDVVALGDLDPLPVERRAIRDPLNQPRAVFDASYDRIDRCLRALLAALPSATAEVSTRG